MASSLDRLGLAACPGECLLVTCSIACDCRERPVPVHFARPGWNIGHQLYAIRRYQLKLTIARRMYASDLKNPGSARRAGVFVAFPAHAPNPGGFSSSNRRDHQACPTVPRKGVPNRPKKITRGEMRSAAASERHLCNVELV